MLPIDCFTKSWRGIFLIEAEISTSSQNYSLIFPGKPNSVNIQIVPEDSEALGVTHFLKHR